MTVVPPLQGYIDMWDATRIHFGPDEDLIAISTTGEFSTEMPGGFGAASFTFLRKPGVRYDPLASSAYASVTVKDSSGRIVYEGRVVGLAKSAEGSLEVECEGWSKHLEDDETATVIFRDIDLSHWQGMSAQRKIDLAASWELNDAENTWDPTIGKPSLRVVLQGSWNTIGNAASEGWYDAGAANRIGSIGYAWRYGANMAGGTANPPWQFNVCVADDDRNNGSEISAHLGAASGTNTLTPTVRRRFGRIFLGYVGAAGNQGADYDAYLQPAVYGNHGLVLRGTEPNAGFYVSDMIPWAVNKWASLLRTTPDSIEATSVTVPHSTFQELTTARNIVEALAVYGGNSNYPLDWFVYDNRTFNLKSPGTYGNVWRVRKDEGADETGQGADMQQFCNGVFVRYDPGDGTSLSVGPPGSGANFETAQLGVADPNHPINRMGTRKWPLVDAGITNQAGAILIGQLVMYDRNYQQWRGDITIEGWVRDSTGSYQPPYMVRAGDYIVVEDSEDTRPRRVISTTYRLDGSCSASVGAPPDRLETLLARAGIVLVAGGIS